MLPPGVKRTPDFRLKSNAAGFLSAGTVVQCSAQADLRVEPPAFSARSAPSRLVQYTGLEPRGYRLQPGRTLQRTMRLKAEPLSPPASLADCLTQLAAMPQEVTGKDAASLAGNALCVNLVSPPMAGEMAVHHC